MTWSNKNRSLAAPFRGSYRFRDTVKRTSSYKVRTNKNTLTENLNRQRITEWNSKCCNHLKLDDCGRAGYSVEMAMAGHRENIASPKHKAGH
jgi:hypothetical protein